MVGKRRGRGGGGRRGLAMRGRGDGFVIRAEQAPHDTKVEHSRVAVVVHGWRMRELELWGGGKGPEGGGSDGEC